MPRALAILCLFPLSLAAGQATLQYPTTKRMDHVDDYHGVKVPDPYRWLEGDVREVKEVADWVADQNKVTFAYLNGISEREGIKRRLTELWNYEKISAPFRAGSRYVFSKNDGLQNHSVYYTQDTLDAPGQMLLDPNTWSKDGTVALAGMEFTEDGKYLGYGVSESGSDWSHWKVMHVESRKTLGDEIRWVKFGGASWTHDNKGFFYSRYPEPKPGQKFQGLPLHQQLYYHRMGTPQNEDVLVYHRPDQPTWNITGGVTDDGRYLIIYVGDGTTSRKSRILYKDLQDPYGLPIELIDNHDSVNSVIHNDGPVFYVKTDADAPRGRVVAIDSQLRRPETQPSSKGEKGVSKKDWKDIIPQGESALQGVNYVGNLLVCRYLKDARTQIKMHRLDGRFVREVALPGIGSAGGFGGRPQDLETFYTFTSFNVPGRTYRYDLITGESKLFREPKVKFNADDYEVKQVFYPSKDGTKIPMFIAHKRGIKLDGNNPTLLYGYGGFNFSLTPTFSISKLAWMEMGGVYAQPNIRGGGEYGRDWHRAATKANRPKAYEDFIAAAEWLIKQKYTSTTKLAIQGGSNGGLLVGAVMCKRPDLFGACLPAVGVMDMLRFHRFTAGRFWTDDYGSADNPEEFKTLFSYSPYHNLKKGTRYPATLVTTADTDDRVVPSHSFKFAAQLQHCHEGPTPVLIRIETRSGHGGGRPVSMVIEEVADEWGFLVRNLGMKVPEVYR
jgi:prolyl oligopeptidase